MERAAREHGGELAGVGAELFPYSDNGWQYRAHPGEELVQRWLRVVGRRRRAPGSQPAPGSRGRRQALGSTPLLGVGEERGRARVEAIGDEILAVFAEGITAQRAITLKDGHGEGRFESCIEVVADDATRLAHVRELLDRAYGKSKRTMEAEFRQTPAMDYSALTPAERERLLELMTKAARGGECVTEMGPR